MAASLTTCGQARDFLDQLGLSARRRAKERCAGCAEILIGLRKLVIKESRLPDVLGHKAKVGQAQTILLLRSNWRRFLRGHSIRQDGTDAPIFSMHPMDAQRIFDCVSEICRLLILGAACSFMLFGPSQLRNADMHKFRPSAKQHGSESFHLEAGRPLGEQEGAPFFPHDLSVEVIGASHPPTTGAWNFGHGNRSCWDLRGAWLRSECDQPLSGGIHRCPFG